MILADTSAWIAFDRGAASALSDRLRTLVGPGGGLAVTEPVMMEVLAGARTDEGAARLEDLLRAQDLLPIEPGADFTTAAVLYRLCRRSGITPRGMLDCLIVAVAWRTGAAVLTADVDLVRIGATVGVPVERL